MTVQGFVENLRVRAVHQALVLGEELAARIPERLYAEALRKVTDIGIHYGPGAEFLYKIVMELMRQHHRLAPKVRRKLLENLVGNLLLLSFDKHRHVKQRVGAWPCLAVISPTMRCNLKCTGCYSAHYGRQDAIDTAAFDSILAQLRALGIYFVVISGGEPYMRHDLLDLFEKHNDMQFMTYTNGTIIARRHLAPRLAELGNVMPAISVEGFAAETDARRGNGVHSLVLEAMRQLREAGVLFGFSATPCRANNDLLVSDEFVQYYLDQGVFFGWYFSYMPVGRNPDLSLMPTPEQRAHRHERIRAIRQKYPILAADFWCDGELVGGCLSAGRNYFHINADGGFEPCVFHQYSVDNVLEKPLIDCLDSEYFRYLRGRLSEVQNVLRPCPVIDRPQILRDCVAKFQPHPSQSGGLETVTTLADGLTDYATRLAQIMDERWEAEGNPPERPQPHHICRAPDNVCADFDSRCHPCPTDCTRACGAAHLAG